MSTGEGWARLPIAVRIGAVYLSARIVTTAFLLIAAELSGHASRFGANADLGSFVLGWDAQWYWLVAENGYPSDLPVTAGGAVAENQWAFMPLYAFLARVAGVPFGSWGAGALLVSVVAGYLACLALHRLLRPRIDAAATMWAVAFFASGPLAALFQVGYAESLFLLFLLLSLGELVRRRYSWLYLLVPLMGYTRPGILAFALLLGLVAVWRWWHRRRDPMRHREVVHLAALAALAVVVGFSWQVIAAIVTGNPAAYLLTELAWRRNWIAGGAEHFIPFDGLFQAADLWFGVWGLPPVLGWALLLIALVAVAAALRFAPQVVRLGIEVRLWSVSYLLYLAAVFFPQSSLFRLLLPLAPLWGAVALPPSRVWRFGVLAACLAGQLVWILSVYASGNTFWQIP